MILFFVIVRGKELAQTAATTFAFYVCGDGGKGGGGGWPE